MSLSTTPVWTTKRKLLGLGLLAVWFGAASLIGLNGWLANNPSSFFPPIALTVVVPVAIFVGLYTTTPIFRALVLAQDPVTLTLMQAWRVIGFGFLTLYFFNVLPGLFAWVAGMAVEPFPSFGVPLFIILHLTVLFKILNERANRALSPTVLVAG